MGVAERMRVEDLWETHIDVPIVSNLKKKNNTVKIVSPGVRKHGKIVFLYSKVCMYICIHTDYCLCVFLYLLFKGNGCVLVEIMGLFHKHVTMPNFCQHL